MSVIVTMTQYFLFFVKIFKSLGLEVILHMKTKIYNSGTVLLDNGKSHGRTGHDELNTIILQEI